MYRQRPSINRSPPKDQDLSIVYAAEHVLTPVTVTRIYYAGEDVLLTEGKDYYVEEAFHYVAEDDPYYDYGTAVLSGYYPMQKDGTYLIFGKYEYSKAYDYQGNKIIFPITFEGVMCVGDEAEVKAANPIRDDQYWAFWKDAMEKYR